jgi:hypothetical protein
LSGASLEVDKEGVSAGTRESTCTTRDSDRRSVCVAFVGLSLGSLIISRRLFALLALEGSAVVLACSRAVQRAMAMISTPMAV